MASKESPVVPVTGFEVERREGDESALAATAGVAAVGREQAEIQAAFIMAARNPRIEADAYIRIVTACKRPGFAEGAQYLYPRGGKNIQGPSVRYAREAARCWGNIRYGYRITDKDEENTTLEGRALDLETNVEAMASTTFRNLIQRKQKTGETKWVQPDERDYRELVAKNGAIVVRNAILQIIPPDITEDAQRVVRDTMVKAAKGEIAQDRDATLRRLALAFREFGVTAEMVEGYLGHGLDIITAEELADLRGIYASISEKQAKREDFFDVGGAKSNGEVKMPKRTGEAAEKSTQAEAPDKGESATAPAKVATAAQAPGKNGTKAWKGKILKVDLQGPSKDGVTTYTIRGEGGMVFQTADPTFGQKATDLMGQPSEIEFETGGKGPAKIVALSVGEPGDH
jgi:hypothetical protein